MAGQPALYEVPSHYLLLVFHRLPLLMQPMRICPSGGRVLIRLPVLLVDAQHLVAGYILQRSNAAVGLPLRAARHALAS
jgi:hypothetical protein